MYHRLVFLCCIVLTWCASCTECEWAPYDGRTLKEYFSTYGLSETEYGDLHTLVSECRRLHNKETSTTSLADPEPANSTILLWGVVPTPEQALRCVNYYKQPLRTRRKRKVFDFSREPTRKWPMPIFYQYTSSHTAPSRNVIESAIAIWQQQTCVRFKRMHPNDKINRTSIIIGAETYTECSSYTGQLASTGGRVRQQPVNLAVPGCVESLGQSLHELGHVIGFWHEHSRADRSNFIKIHLQNVKSPSRHNFDVKHSAGLTQYAYDLTSIMHYHQREGVKLNVKLPTITTWDRDYQRTIGQRTTLSFLDKKAANDMYCADICTKKNACRNGGYTDPNRCGRCKCPDGFGGKLCGSVASASGGCWPNSREHIKLRSAHEYCVESRDYANGGLVQRGDKCNWLIEAPKGCRIRGRIAGKFGLYCPPRIESCFQWLEVRYQSIIENGPRLCCKKAHRTHFTSEKNRMMILLNAEYPVNDHSMGDDVPKTYRTGFRFCYRILDATCLPNRWTAPSRQLSRPNSTKMFAFAAKISRKNSCKRWGPWSGWSRCTKRCGGCGQMMRYRKCITPFKRIQTQRKNCAISVQCGTRERDWLRFRVKLPKLQRTIRCCYRIKNGLPVKLASSWMCDAVKLIWS